MKELVLEKYGVKDGQSAIVCPLTSAQNERGGEKYAPGSVKKSWLRVHHLGRMAYILVEQVRYADMTKSSWTIA